MGHIDLPGIIFDRLFLGKGTKDVADRGATVFCRQKDLPGGVDSSNVVRIGLPLPLQFVKNSISLADCSLANGNVFHGCYLGKNPKPDSAQHPFTTPGECSSFPATEPLHNTDVFYLVISAIVRHHDIITIRPNGR